MTTLRSGSATHVGQVRSNNQDSFLVEADADLFGVADGMGGHNGGEVASAMAVENLKEHAGEPTLENLMEAARLGNRAIFERAGDDAELHGMGTTLCAVRVVPGPEGDEIAWINVGDSRVYLFRDDDLIQLSRDHSLVEDLVRDGQLTEAEAAVHPKRNIITRALGIDVDVDVDGATVIPFNGDRYLLCSDGLFGEVSDDQISAVLRRLADPGEAADELVRLANESGGRDNITVVIAEVIDDDGRSAAAAAARAEEEKRLAERKEQAEAAATPVDAGALGAGVDGDEPETEPLDEPDIEPEPETEPYVPAMADRRSSLPEADDDYAAEVDDPYAGMEGLDHKRFTWRVVVFAIALLSVIFVVVAALAFSARDSYFVAFKGDEVVVYQGQPGGFLWMDPSLELKTGIMRDDLPEDVRLAVAGKKEFGSESDVTVYVVNLKDIAAGATTTTVPPSTTSSSSTSSTSSSTSTTTTTAPTTTTTR